MFYAYFQLLIVIVQLPYQFSSHVKMLSLNFMLRIENVIEFFSINVHVQCKIIV